MGNGRWVARGGGWGVGGGEWEVGSGIFMYDTWHVSVVVVKSTHSTGVQKTSECALQKVIDLCEVCVRVCELCMNCVEADEGREQSKG